MNELCSGQKDASEHTVAGQQFASIIPSDIVKLQTNPSGRDRREGNTRRHWWHMCPSAWRRNVWLCEMNGKFRNCNDCDSYCFVVRWFGQGTHAV